MTRLFPKESSAEPANRVIASADEIRTVRTALGRAGVTPAWAEELGIPEEALEQLPDQDAFLAARRRWLAEEERKFIASFFDQPLGVPPDAS